MVEFFTNFFSNLVDGIFLFVGFIINFVLTPIDALVNQYIGNTNGIVNVCNRFFSNLTDVGNWVLSFSGIPQAYLNLVITMWIFILTVPLLVYGVRLAIKWFNTLKVG